MTIKTGQREYSETIPVQYQDGFVVFMGHRISVDSRVLIPRPETELLVKVSGDELDRMSSGKANIIDMCTGSGVIAIALSKRLPDLKVRAVDISSQALEVAAKNVEDAGLSKCIDLGVSDLFSSFDDTSRGVYDAIVSNPPYVSARDFEFLDPWVKAEPSIALYAGEKGMDYLNAICVNGGLYLKKNGFLALEIAYDQAFMVKEKMVECGFDGIKSFNDPNGYERVVMGWKKNG